MNLTELKELLKDTTVFSILSDEELQQFAEPGAILISEATRRAIEKYGGVDVAAGPSPPGVCAYRIVGVSRAGVAMRQSTRVVAPFVGRERELIVLGGLLAETLSGKGQAVSVVGEPGMGKSRLVAATRDSGMETLQWVREATARGAGEIVLNCMRNDGIRNGYDIEHTREVVDAVSVPVIASGGAGAPEHFRDAFTAGASGALCQCHPRYGTLAQS